MAEQHARMRGKLADKMARDAETAANQEASVGIREQMRPVVDNWAKNNKGNIVGLLMSLDKVLD